MQSNDWTDESLTGFEQKVSAWQPQSGGLDRDRMLFEAGVAAGKSATRSKLLYVPSGIAMAAALVMGAMLQSTKSQLVRVEDRCAMLESKGIPPGKGERGSSPGPMLAAADSVSGQPPSPTSMWSLRNQMLASSEDFVPRRSAVELNSSKASADHRRSPRPTEVGRFIEQ